MLESFIGYVLPWGQISFWGATVITNMFTAIPYIGRDIMEWVWGGYTVCNATLHRFYSLHFLVPFVIIVFACLHIFLLHEKGRNNPLGIERDTMCIPFHPFYTAKDLFGFVCLGWGLIFLVLVKPEILGNVYNFIPADPMHTPHNVQPEWYFLFAYAILRSVPTKGIGIIIILMSILVLFFLPLLHRGQFRSLAFYPLNQHIFWLLVARFIGLSYAGHCPAREPWLILGKRFSVFYFCCILFNPLSLKLWDKIISN